MIRFAWAVALAAVFVSGDLKAQEMESPLGGGPIVYGRDLKSEAVALHPDVSPVAGLTNAAATSQAVASTDSDTDYDTLRTMHRSSRRGGRGDRGDAGNRGTTGTAGGHGPGTNAGRSGAAGRGASPGSLGAGSPHGNVGASHASARGGAGGGASGMGRGR